MINDPVVPLIFAPVALTSALQQRKKSRVAAAPLTGAELLSWWNRPELRELVSQEVILWKLRKNALLFPLVPQRSGSTYIIAAFINLAGWNLAHG